MDGVAQVLSGQRALVTGAGTGLGRAMAIGLAAAGAEVVLVGRRAALLAETAEHLATEGAASRTIAPDVTSAADVERLSREAGPIGILVNNAGTSDRQPWLDIARQDWDRIVDLDLHAPFRLAQVFAPPMIEAGGGRIINVSSVYGMLAPDRSLYPNAPSFDL